MYTVNQSFSNVGNLWVLRPAGPLTHIPSFSLTHTRSKAENSSSVLSCHVTMDQRLDLNPLLDPHSDTEDVILCVCLYVCVSSALSVSEGNRSVGRSEALNGGSPGFI